jgi:hypothetical protein
MKAETGVRKTKGGNGGKNIQNKNLRRQKREM